MKIYLVFVALAIVFVTAIFFKIDYDRVDMLQTEVKQQAENSVSGAIFCINNAGYADGHVIFEDARVVDYIEHTLTSDIKYELVIFDHSNTMRRYENGVATGSAVTISYPYLYTDSFNHKQEVEGPAIGLTVIKKTGDIYRLPILEKTEVARSTMYSFEGR